MDGNSAASDGEIFGSDLVAGAAIVARVVRHTDLVAAGGVRSAEEVEPRKTKRVEPAIAHFSNMALMGLIRASRALIGTIFALT